MPHPARAARQQQQRNHRTSLLYRTRQNCDIQSLGTAPIRIRTYSHSVPHPASAARQQLRNHLTTKKKKSAATVLAKIAKYSHLIPHPVKKSENSHLVPHLINVRSTLRAQSALFFPLYIKIYSYYILTKYNTKTQISQPIRGGFSYKLVLFLQKDIVTCLNLGLVHNFR